MNKRLPCGLGNHAAELFVEVVLLHEFFDGEVHAVALAVGVDGWNWIGFNSNGYLSPDEAFAGLEPQTGDVIKGRNAFAMFMDYEWVGSLTALTPGEGYVYMSNDDQTKTFCYPSIAGRSMRAPMQTEGNQPKYTACDEHKYQGNMTMIAKVMMDGEPLDCELAVFDSNGECRATGMSQSDNLIFLTIQGEGYGEQLSFRVVFTYKDNEEDVLASETYIFSNDDIAGTPDAPFIINLSETSIISDIEIDATDEPMYDVLGRRVKKDNPVTGVYIRGNEKVLIK